ncbi:MAG: glycosyltransferase, partial [Anaerolineae bacterium]|nr:glycosyltransferase [Anaerolineae bacterium]
MNIFIVTLGSRGDVQPYVALGKGLKAAGHTVTVCTSASFEPFITSHGLHYGYMNNELLDLMDSAEGREAMEEAVGILGSLKTMAKLAKEGNRINRQLLKEAWEAAQLANPELIIFHPKAFSGPQLAEKFGVPAIMAVMQPMIVPTVETPPIGIPILKLGGWYNKLGYSLISMGYNAYRGMINTFREESLGIGKLPRSQNALKEVAGQPIPVLHAFSRYVLPRPADWPDYAHVTGYWFLDQSNAWEPSNELLAFLDAGAPPVYVGFGSMAGKNPQRLAEIVIDALQQAGVRGIIATGWGGLETSDLPETIFKLDQAPHDWLFPRMSAVVHHGGAGTTAAGLRAGRPTIICTFIADQPFWGQRVHALGAGSKPIPQKQ